jgi:putative Holliday junction resolvase
MPNWLAIDYGTVRLGLAVGDTDTRIASPLEVIPAQPQDRAFQRIAQTARQYQAAGVVVGLPINMDDTLGPQATWTRSQAQALARATGLDVRLWDERLSSFQADSDLAGHLTRNKRRARQDAIAAATFLQEFLNAQGPESAEKACPDP